MSRIPLALLAALGLTLTLGCEPETCYDLYTDTSVLQLKGTNGPETFKGATILVEYMPATVEGCHDQGLPND